MASQSVKSKANRPKKRKAVKLSQAKKLVRAQRRLSLALATLLIVVGISLVSIAGIFLAYRRTSLSFEVAPAITVNSKFRLAAPTRITIPSAKIDLPVDSAQIVKGIWQTSPNHPTHLESSARPGEHGNVIIYGHNLRKIFGPLIQVKLGDKIEVVSSDGRHFTYQVNQITVVTPDQISTVLPTNYEVLTIYTCTGFLDSKRLVIKAVPLEN
jgi:LPXTG-site transpeptidase (sortase) family protein